MNEILRLLQVEASASDAALTEGALIKAGYTVCSERVENAPQMRTALAKQSWDLIVADYRLPQFDAKSALSLLHESGHDIPFIVVSGALGEELAVSMMKAGAQDYLLKRNLARLAPAVEREMGTFAHAGDATWLSARSTRAKNGSRPKEPRCSGKRPCCTSARPCFGKSTIA